jgi:hypothetical protein
MTTLDEGKAYHRLPHPRWGVRCWVTSSLSTSTPRPSRPCATRRNWDWPPSIRYARATGRSLTATLRRDPGWGLVPIDPTGSLCARGRQGAPGGLEKLFGTGERSCIGRQFALHEAVLLAVMICLPPDRRPGRRSPNG